MENQKPKTQRKLEGIVVSDKMMKTVVIAVTTHHTNPKYQKQYKVTNRFKAHDEHEICGVGDHAVIAETRPLSRAKRWIVVSCQSQIANREEKAQS